MRLCPTHILLAGSIATLTGCAHGINYLSEAGPRYAGSVGSAPPQPVVRVVTLNTHYAAQLDRQITLFQENAVLRDADIVVLQEMDEESVQRVAQALRLNYVYYPATLHPGSGRDFGNALLSRWTIENDRKLILPHRSWSDRTQRVAVAGTVRIGPQSVRVYAVHFGTLIDIGPEGQEDQARTVLRDADGSSIPVIVAGDLNSVQAGKVFEHSGFAWPTKGLGHTYALFDFDHIFVRGLPTPASPAAGIARDSLHVSDHRPVWVVLTLGASSTEGSNAGLGGGE